MRRVKGGLRAGKPKEEATVGRLLCLTYAGLLAARTIIATAAGRFAVIAAGIASRVTFAHVTSFLDLGL
jgi:hypothetical protein